MVIGRFAPSPTGPLHLGNLRTALIAWVSARQQGGRFLVRMEDLDRITSSDEHASGQLADLAALGIDHDGEVVRQSDRFDLHRAAVAELGDRGLTYHCYCTRREIREAASAPHGPVGAYPGTCRELTAAQIAAHEADGRPAALRLRADGRHIEFVDLVAGPRTGVPDDVVLVRNDGVPAYNLAVVVDDHEQGVTEVVRGDDLLDSTPRQLLIADLLGFVRPRHAHVPLIVGPDGDRLAKRHGAVTLADLATEGVGIAEVLAGMAASLGWCSPEDRPTAADLVERLDWASLPRHPWRYDGWR